MPVESAADRAVFIAATEFGESIGYRPASGAETTITVLIDRQPIDVFGSDSAGTEADAIVVTVCTAAVPGLTQTARFTIDDITYRPATIRPDGTGMTAITLREA
jgi:hypothetical protein